MTLTPGQGQIMYVLVNVSPTKPLDVATSNFLAEYVTYDAEGTEQHLCDLDPKVKRSNNEYSCKCISS